MTIEQLQEIKSHAEANVEASLQARNEGNFCKVFEYAEPILTIFSKLWFLPKKVRYIIADLIAVAAQFCAVNPEFANVIKAGAEKEQTPIYPA